MAANNKSKKWPEVLEIRRKGGTENAPYVVFRPGVEILVNGEKLDLGEYRSLRCVKAAQTIEFIDKLLDAGTINEEEHEKRTSRLKNTMYIGVLSPKND